MKTTLCRSIFNRLRALSCSLAIATSSTLLSANRAPAVVFSTYFEPANQLFQLTLPDLPYTLYSQVGLAGLLNEGNPLQPLFSRDEITTAIVPLPPQTSNYQDVLASGLGTAPNNSLDISLPLFHSPLTCEAPPTSTSQASPGLPPLEENETSVGNVPREQQQPQVDSIKLPTEHWNFNDANDAMTSAFENYISSLSASGIAWQF